MSSRLSARDPAALNGTTRRASGSSHGVAFATFSISVAFVASVLLTMQTGELALTQLLGPSACLFILSAFAYVKCGGQTINASSVASLGIFIFGGFAGLYTSQGLNGDRATTAVEGILLAIVFLFAFQLSLMIASFKPVGHPPPKSKSNKGDASHNSRIAIGVLAFGISAVGVLIGDNVYLAPFSILGIFILVDSFLRSGTNKTRLAATAIFATALIFFYYEFLFSGFGRLVLAVLGCGVAILFSLHMRTRVFKFLVLIAACAALPILAMQRLKFLEEARGSEPLESEGIGSVVGPLVSFGQLIEGRLSNLIDLSWGSTLWDTATLWIPRQIWPGKPSGFGFDIVPYTQPNLAGNEGFSDAAMFGGELVWNFGIIGAFICIPVVAYLIFFLNKRLAVIPSKSDSFSNFVSRITVVVLISALLHFIWAGTYTYLARIFVILLFLLFLKVVAFTAQKKSQTE